tara:strand:+ start:4372 stop:4560 length:189 start_codon:yes stop_codon:yes gene_type:complete
VAILIFVANAIIHCIQGSIDADIVLWTMGGTLMTNYVVLWFFWGHPVPPQPDVVAEILDKKG